MAVSVGKAHAEGTARQGLRGQTVMNVFRAVLALLAPRALVTKATATMVQLVKDRADQAHAPLGTGATIATLSVLVSRTMAFATITRQGMEHAKRGRAKTATQARTATSARQVSLASFVFSASASMAATATMMLRGQENAHASRGLVGPIVSRAALRTKESTLP